MTYQATYAQHQRLQSLKGKTVFAKSWGLVLLAEQFIAQTALEQILPFLSRR